MADIIKNRAELDEITKMAGSPISVILREQYARANRLIVELEQTGNSQVEALLNTADIFMDEAASFAALVRDNPLTDPTKTLAVRARVRRTVSTYLKSEAAALGQ